MTTEEFTTIKARHQQLVEKIPARREHIRQQRAAAPDPEERRQQYLAAMQEHAALDAEDQSIDRAHRALREATAQIEADLPLHAQQTQIRGTLLAEASQLGDNRHDPVVVAKREALALSVRIVELNVPIGTGHRLADLPVGRELIKRGYVVPPLPPDAIGTNRVMDLEFPGSLSEIEHRLKMNSDKVAAADRDLAEALMDDEARAKQQATIAERNARPRRKLRGLSNDGTFDSEYVVHSDGRVEEVGAS